MMFEKKYKEIKMIKVSIMYPYSGKSSFNMDYYCDKHIPMVEEFFGTTCQGITVDEGIIDEDTDQLPAFYAMTHFYFESVEIFHNTFSPYAGKIMSDAVNYTDIEPIIQISNIIISTKKGIL